jgi:RNA 2',3'-cyclic 3'-phosphodiesterase
MIRSFIAIDLSTEIRESIAAISRRLSRLGLDGRFSKPESTHLTLKFLGSIEESRVPHIHAAMERSLQGIEPFTLLIRSLGVFPHLGNPRVLWVGVEPSHALSLLQRRLEETLGELGFEAETRPFRPHLTLIRLRSSRNLAELVQFLRQEGDLDVGSLPVDAVHLYQSILRPEGAEYRRLVGVRLPVR